MSNQPEGDDVYTSDPRTEDYSERGSEPGDNKAIQPGTNKLSSGARRER